jgi:hypothetical protein
MQQDKIAAIEAVRLTNENKISIFQQRQPFTGKNAILAQLARARDL